MGWLSKSYTRLDIDDDFFCVCGAHNTFLRAAGFRKLIFSNPVGVITIILALAIVNFTLSAVPVVIYRTKGHAEQRICNMSPSRRRLPLTRPKTETISASANYEFRRVVEGCACAGRALRARAHITHIVSRSSRCELELLASCESKSNKFLFAVSRAALNALAFRGRLSTSGGILTRMRKLCDRMCAAPPPNAGAGGNAGHQTHNSATNRSHLHSESPLLQHHHHRRKQAARASEHSTQLSCIMPAAIHSFHSNILYMPPPRCKA